MNRSMWFLSVSVILTGAAAWGQQPPGVRMDDKYILQPRDVLAISVWGLPDYSLPQVQISVDGKIAHPVVGEVMAAGSTCAQFAEALRKKLMANELKDPLVTVTVVMYHQDQIFVGGAVLKAGPVPFTDRLSLQQAVASGGGLAPNADTANITVLAPNGKPQVVDLNANGTMMLENLCTVIVGERKPVAVLGAVHSPGIYGIPPAPGNRLSDAVGLANGLTPDAEAENCHLSRAGGVTLTVDFEKINQNVADPANITLQAGDALYFPSRLLETFSVVGEVKNPGVMQLDKVTHLSAGIGKASGFTVDADPTKVLLMRADGSVTPINVKDIIEGRTPEADVLLRPGDAVLVPHLRLPDVAVLGGVKLPGRFSVPVGSRVSSALALAGGLDDRADTTYATIMHLKGKAERVDLPGILANNAAADILLTDGDTLIVPSLAQTGVTVIGPVNRPGRYTLADAKRISDLVALADRRLDASDSATLMRADGATVNVDLKLALSDKGSAANLVLKDGDLLIINNATRNVVVLGAVALPGQKQCREGDRFSDAVGAAGDMVPDADREDATLQHITGETVKVNPEQAYAHKTDNAANPLLQNFDTIFIKGAQNQVVVLGDVTRPGVCNVRVDDHFSDAIARAGGLLPTTRVRTASVWRRGGTVVKVDLDAVLNKHDQAQNVALQAGDTIMVQAGPVDEVTVLGHVTTPQKVVLAAGDRVSDVIAKAGGLAPDADDRKATLMRADGGVVHVDLQGALKRNDPAANILVGAGDTLWVEPMTRGHVGVIGEVKMPGYYPIEEGNRISDVLAKAAGPGEVADQVHCTLRHQDGSTVPVNLTQIGALEANLKVADGDTLYVPTLDVGRATVIGTPVRTPGPYPIGRSERVSGLLARGGGLTQGVVVLDAILMHGDGTSIRLDIAAALAAPGGEKDPAVRDGDILVVDEALPVTVVGAVKGPGVLPMLPHSRVSEAVARAQGPADTADLANATLMHRDGSSQRVDLARALLDHVREADVEMQPGDVLIIPGADYHVAVIGAVVTPGRYPINNRAHVTDAIALAAGLGPTADPKRCSIWRGTQKIEVDLKRVMEEKDLAANLALQDGDTVFVAELRKTNVFVGGEVVSPGLVTPPGGTALRLSGALAQAGWVRPDGDPANVKVTRGTTTRVVDITDWIKGRGFAGDMDLQDGDMVLVPQSQHNVVVIGCVQKPGVYKFSPGDTAVMAFAQAGGASDSSAPNRTVIQRKGPDGKLIAFQVDLMKAQKDKKLRDSLVLHDDDEIYVPDRSRRTLRDMMQTIFPLATIATWF